MISYSFDDTSKTPLYEQLYKLIRNDITSGALAPHAPLPSKRTLAEQLSVSVITVENAYSQLLSEGYIYSEPRRGFYVMPLSVPTEGGTMEQSRQSQLKQAADKLAAQGTGQPDVHQKTYFADFSSNASDPATFPFATWAKLTRRILSDDQEKLMTNPPSSGMYDLRLAIADYLRQFRGIAVNPNNIIIGAGTETLYSILINLLGNDKTYATENPGYEKIAHILDSNSLKNVRIPLDEDGIIIEELEKNNVNVIHTTPSHHFPTGITMPIKRRLELLAWADDTNKTENKNTKNRYIIEDDYDSEFRLSGRPIPALMSIDSDEKVIYMNTFTKSLASTIRISYMILPEHLMSEYKKKLSFYSCPVSTFEQLTLANFISEGYYEKHINRMRTASRKKRDLLLKAIKTGPLGAISEISEEQSGLHFILKIKTRKSDKDFREACLREGINITSIQGSSKSYMINYSSIPIERIEEAVERIDRACH